MKTTSNSTMGAILLSAVAGLTSSFTPNPEKRSLKKQPTHRPALKKAKARNIITGKRCKRPMPRYKNTRGW